MEEKLWRRLISNFSRRCWNGKSTDGSNCSNFKYNEKKKFLYAEPDRAMFFIHAIRLMCESMKDRSSDLLKNIIIKNFAMGYVPEIPDIALDKHTLRGQELGRGSEHFLKEASKVFPQAEVDNNYKEEYEKLLGKYYSSSRTETEFKFNNWQS